MAVQLQQKEFYNISPRPKARFKPTLPKKYVVDGGSKIGANISWSLASRW